MSQFTTGFRTMERQRDAEANFCDSSNLLRSEPSSPDVWETSTMNNNGTAPKRYEVETPKPILKNGGVRFTHPSEYNEKDAADLEDVDQMVPGKPEFPDWRRSAVLTVFIFPPTGLLAMILACLSHSSAQKGEYERARRLNCCSCWMVFISLLGSLTFIMICILFRVYGVLDPPF